MDNQSKEEQSQIPQVAPNIASQYATGSYSHIDGANYYYPYPGYYPYSTGTSASPGAAYNNQQEAFTNQSISANPYYYQPSLYTGGSVYYHPAQSYYYGPVPMAPQMPLMSQPAAPPISRTHFQNNPNKSSLLPPKKLSKMHQSAAPKKEKQPQIPARCNECSKDFPNVKMYQAHVQQHIKCEFCDFSASKKIVLQHSKETHPQNQLCDIDTQRNKESNKPTAFPKPWLRIMETEEEINQWIEARRKNYPTEENISRKASQTTNTNTSKARERRRVNEILNTFMKRSDRNCELSSSSNGDTCAPVTSSQKRKLNSIIDYDGQSEDEDDVPPEEKSTGKEQETVILSGQVKRSKPEMKRRVPQKPYQKPKKRGDLFEMLACPEEPVQVTPTEDIVADKSENVTDVEEQSEESSDSDTSTDSSEISSSSSEDEE